MKLTIRASMLAVLFALAAAAQNEPRPATPDAPKPDAVKPFADVVKGAAESAGLFRLYRTEDNKIYAELAPSDFEKLFMLSMTCESGIGEKGVYAVAMCGETPILFRKHGPKNVQIIARNPLFRAEEGTPMARAVARSFADSVVGLASVASRPHPERKSVLIDLGAVFLTDVPMYSYHLERTFRIPYRFDARNSSLGRLKAFERNVELETIAHYAADRPALPPLLAPGAPTPPQVDPPKALPDLRSMLLRFRYSISELPEAGYRPRLADDRVGFFLDQIQDYSDHRDANYTPAVRYINRWRLEKADPGAALSRPKKPIVYWLENTIPVRYRAAVREGALMWNKAFERIGFKDAIEVREQPDDADWDPADVRYNTIRWFAGVDAGFAQGPSRSNPFTGEIYDADIRFAEIFPRGRRQTIVLESKPLSAASDEEAPAPYRAPWSTGKADGCSLMSDAVREIEFGAEVLAVRGIEPDSPEADKLVNEYLKWISAHEVGHTLGLRHNFRASSIRRLDQMHNAEATSSEGLIGSMMDYTPLNIAAKGAKQGEYHQSTLGAYDYWAIEYAYKPIEAGSPEDELPELRKIASRAADPLLAYSTDEDAGGFGQPYELDPLANRFDLGSDPLQFYTHRIKLSREIWANLETKLQKPGEGYQVMRRSFNSAMGQSRAALTLAAKYIGGVYHYRDHMGDPNGRLPYQPVPAAKQKEALQLINENCFAPRAFQFSPQLLNKLANERLTDRYGPSPMTTPRDLPVHESIVTMQRAILDRIFHPIVLKRIVDNELRYSAAADRFRMSDLFLSVQDSVWAEMQSTAGISVNSLRRGLQREHLRKLIGLVLRDAAAPEDARTMARYSLTTLRDRLQAALGRADAKMSIETRAHVGESLARIDEALKANLQRMAY